MLLFVFSTRMISHSCKTRSSLICIYSDSSPTSSKINTSKPSQFSAVIGACKGGLFITE